VLVLVLVLVLGVGLVLAQVTGLTAHAMDAADHEHWHQHDRGHQKDLMKWLASLYTR
jgi:hypothetical protein